MPTIGAFEELSQTEDDSYLLRKEFARSRPDHHADYVKTQHIIWEKVSVIPGILPMRSEVIEAEYPHVPAFIKDLLVAGTTRPRTCR